MPLTSICGSKSNRRRKNLFHDFIFRNRLCRVSYALSPGHHRPWLLRAAVYDPGRPPSPLDQNNPVGRGIHRNPFVLYIHSLHANQMITLRENETIEYIARRHWIGIVVQATTTAILFLAPLLIIPIEPFIERFLPKSTPGAVLFFSLLYWMILLLFFYIELLNYWLDMWIITNQRIIDVEHQALFHRQVSEFSTARVQDITVEVEGVFASLLGYGDVSIQTAGEQSFSIKRVANPELVKNAIMHLARTREGI